MDREKMIADVSAKALELLKADIVKLFESNFQDKPDSPETVQDKGAYSLIEITTKKLVAAWAPTKKAEKVMISRAFEKNDLCRHYASESTHLCVQINRNKPVRWLYLNKSQTQRLFELMPPCFWREAE